LGEKISGDLPVDEHKLCELLKGKLEELGYKIQSNVTLGQIAIDLLATKEGKNAAIEVKTTKEGVLSGIEHLVRLRILPEVDLIYIAAPDDALTEDIHTIAKYSPIGIGLISIFPDNSIKFSLSPQEIEKARLTLVSASQPTRVVPGEIFALGTTFGNSGEKICRHIEVECTPIGPFEQIDEKVKKFEELFPGDRKNAEFRFRVKDGACAGRYFIFIKWASHAVKGSQIFDVEIEAESAEYIERLVGNAIAQLSRVSSENLEDTLRQIDRAVEKGYLNVQNHIYNKSIWNSLGAAYLKEGMLKQAELVYRAMLKTLEKYEAEHNQKVHKGLAFHNLGIILYRQEKLKDAKDMLLKAFEEDKLTYGSESASKGQAKKALDELQFEKS
jgi:hypothetical protein